MSAFDDSSLKELIKRVVTEDAQAEGALYNRYKRAFYRLIKNLLWAHGCHPLEDHALEIESSVWLKIFQHIKDLSDPDKFRSWAQTIIRRDVFNHLWSPKGCIEEQRLLCNVEELTEEPAGQIDSAEEVTVDAEQWGRILAIAETINPKLPDIMILRHVEGLSFEEIGLRVGESYANVRNIYYRGIIKLRNELREGEE